MVKGRLKRQIKLFIAKQRIDRRLPEEKFLDSERKNLINSMRIDVGKRPIGITEDELDITQQQRLGNFRSSEVGVENSVRKSLWNIKGATISASRIPKHLLDW